MLPVVNPPDTAGGATCHEPGLLGVPRYDSGPIRAPCPFGGGGTKGRLHDKDAPRAAPRYSTSNLIEWYVLLDAPELLAGW